MTIYSKDGSVENCLSVNTKLNFGKPDRASPCRDALTFYQDDIQTEATEAWRNNLATCN